MTIEKPFVTGLKIGLGVCIAIRLDAGFRGACRALMEDIEEFKAKKEETDSKEYKPRYVTKKSFNKAPIGFRTA